MKKGLLAGISTVGGALAGATAFGISQRKRMMADQEHRGKMNSFYHLLVQWLTIKQEGKSLASFFVENGYKTIAIYGMKELGERLYEELEDSEVEVKYIIDKNADAMYADVDIITPDEPLEEVDAIVVTAVYYFGEIEEMLEEKVDCPVLSLGDIVFEV